MEYADNDSVMAKTVSCGRLNWNGNGQRRWVCFWTDICWTSRNSGAAILQVSASTSGSPPRDTGCCSRRGSGIVFVSEILAISFCEVNASLLFGKH